MRHSHWVLPGCLPDIGSWAGDHLCGEIWRDAATVFMVGQTTAQKGGRTGWEGWYSGEMHVLFRQFMYHSEAEAVFVGPSAPNLPTYLPSARNICGAATVSCFLPCLLLNET